VHFRFAYCASLLILRLGVFLPPTSFPRITSIYFPAPFSAGLTPFSVSTLAFSFGFEEGFGIRLRPAWQPLQRYGQSYFLFLSMGFTRQLPLSPCVSPVPEPFLMALPPPLVDSQRAAVTFISHSFFISLYLLTLLGDQSPSPCALQTKPLPVLQVSILFVKLGWLRCPFLLPPTVDSYVHRQPISFCIRSLLFSLSFARPIISLPFSSSLIQRK